jgi:hypothetical protein
MDEFEKHTFPNPGRAADQHTAALLNGLKKCATFCLTAYKMLWCHANARDAGGGFGRVHGAASQQNLATMRFFVKPENPRQRMGRVQGTVTVVLAYWYM